MTKKKTKKDQKKKKIQRHQNVASEESLCLSRSPAPGQSLADYFLIQSLFSSTQLPQRGPLSLDFYINNLSASHSRLTSKEYTVMRRQSPNPLPRRQAG